MLEMWAEGVHPAKEGGERKSVHGQGGHRVRLWLRRPEVLPGISLGPEVHRGFVEGCLERVEEDEPEDEESFLRAEWEEWASSWSCGSQGWRSEWSIPEVSDPQGVSRE